MLRTKKSSRKIWKEWMYDNSSVFPFDIQSEELSVYSFREPPLKICTAEEIIDDNSVVISTPGHLDQLVRVATFVDRDLLEPGCTVIAKEQVYFSQPFFHCVDWLCGGNYP